MELVIKTERDAEAVVLALYGHLGLASVPTLEDELRRAELAAFRHVVIDLSALERIDDAGIDALLREQQRLLEDGRELTLLRGPRTVHSVFERSGALHLFAFEDESAVSDRHGNSSGARLGSLRSVLDVLQDFDDLGGGSVELVAWELGVDETVIARTWSTAIHQGLLKPAGRDTIYGEEMWRITERGRQARRGTD